ncbi:MAG: pseudaminic acid synthase [Candidatus Altiarchaeales archaeon HGW-Altiarchaeales-2]|nr:MAG: pseudaminic acid synthase [Candidatus Altiarchaeales archaeon HGW-Altiarchaeales-2]
MIKNIKINGRLIGDEQPTYIIAEVGSNFDGSLEQAKKIVDLAKEAGADAVKFQSFLVDKIICGEAFTEKVSFQAKWGKSVYDVYKNAEFPREWHQEIMEYCKKKNITFFSSPYDKGAVDLLDEIDVPAFKVGSGDINFYSLIEYMAKKGKPMIVGVGASTMGEIEEAVKTIRSTGNNDIIILQCITNYPSPFEQANIRAMVTLRNAFQVNVGYSDHTPGSLVPLGAVALGACMIEKHFTFDKTRPGPDHPFAMDVSEFKKMVEDIRMMEKALGSYIKEPVPAEKETIILQKRCIYSSVDIPKGTKIAQDMIAVLRPDKGIKPKYFDIVVGREAKVDIPKGTPITWDKI